MVRNGIRPSTVAHLPFSSPLGDLKEAVRPRVLASFSQVWHRSVAASRDCTSIPRPECSIAMAKGLKNGDVF